MKKQQEMALGIEHMPTMTSYVRQQFIIDGHEDPVSNVPDAESSEDSDSWSPITTADVTKATMELTEAMELCLEHFHEDDETRVRYWVETRIREG